uniref:DNA_mis_repair domain-containing protein n=1 Tax=Angiostrongylus cantonensis TaxID=6313 RepID=A0A158P8M6_ANGCA
MSSILLGGSVGNGGSRLVVNRRRQEGNPVLKYVRNYHKLHPNYILSRLSGKDENKYACRILLTLCNVDEPRHTLRELNLLCYRMDWTLVLCYSVEEAAEYIENFKLSDNRDPAFK